MTHDNFADLMNREIDGANSEAESRQLHEHLESNPQARERFEEFKLLATRLDATPQVDPPPHLFHRIIEAIPFGKRRQTAPRGFGAWIAGILPTPGLRYASTFAVGIVAGFVILFVTMTGKDTGGPLDVNQLYGTMKTIDNTDGLSTVGSHGIELDGIHGDVHLHEQASDRALVADVSLHSTDPIRWTLSYDQTDVALEGFRQVEGGAGEVVSDATGFTVDQAGDGRFILFFSEKDTELAPITLSIYSAGKLLQSIDLTGPAGE